MRPINRFLLDHQLRIAQNPCISPDFCLDWPGLLLDIRAGRVTEYPKSQFRTALGQWSLWENAQGDHAWKLVSSGGECRLPEGLSLGEGVTVFPATWEHLLRLKNLVQEYDGSTTIFPTAGGNLGKSTLGVGARWTTLHWPAVDWAMSALELGVTANQNSIPRELVYDVEEMLAGKLDRVPFPFIGTSVPEGHQGQSVEGMSHGCVLSKLKTGFHHRRLAWSFNADHQPIGGKFDVREDQLVTGCILASYITFDLSPELALQAPAQLNEIPSATIQAVKARVAAVGLNFDDGVLAELLTRVWPALQKLKLRDDKYAAARRGLFTTEVGRQYLRELSIDELPGLTTPETTAIMLALCEALGLQIHFIAPAFGFQKNIPYDDNARLREIVQQQWQICRQFRVSLGFHSGSGKSAENYQVLGEVTGGCLEIKTSGRYTYEMGRALFASTDAGDQALWHDWYNFTVNLAVKGSFSRDQTEKGLARQFILAALGASAEPTRVFASESETRAALAALRPSPEHMFWFEYNFLFILAAEGRADKSALGDHSAAGYRQRARFYSISDEGRLRYAKNVATYLIFLAESTGLVATDRCAGARKLLERYTALSEMLADISR